MKTLLPGSKLDAFLIDFFEDVYTMLSSSMDNETKINILFSMYTADDVLESLRRSIH